MSERIILASQSPSNPEQIRIISPEPKIGLMLLERKPLIIPEPLNRWAAEWVRDVGAILRDRNTMAGTVAGLIQWAFILGIISLVPGLREAVETLPIAKRVLRFG
jgi:hypothetical protein